MRKLRAVETVRYVTISLVDWRRVLPESLMCAVFHAVAVGDRHKIGAEDADDMICHIGRRQPAHHDIQLFKELDNIDRLTLERRAGLFPSGEEFRGLAVLEITVVNGVVEGGSEPVWRNMDALAAEPGKHTEIGFGGGNRLGNSAISLVADRSADAADKARVVRATQDGEENLAIVIVKLRDDEFASVGAPILDACSRLVIKTRLIDDVGLEILVPCTHAGVGADATQDGFLDSGQLVEMSGNARIVGMINPVLGVTTENQILGNVNRVSVESGADDPMNSVVWPERLKKPLAETRFIERREGLRVNKAVSKSVCTFDERSDRAAESSTRGNVFHQGLKLGFFGIVAERGLGVVNTAAVGSG